MSTVLTDKEALPILSANIRAKMAEKEIGLRALARITGDTVGTLQGVWDGEHLPRAGLLSRIAEALGTTVDALFEPQKKSRRSA